MGNPAVDLFATLVAGQRRPSTRIGGRIKDILIAFAIMTVPMILFSALLLGLVFHFRIVQNAFVSDKLAFNSGQDDPSVFFVRISATTLITIASWSSTLAPLLVGFATTLISYPVASGILVASRKYKMGLVGSAGVTVATRAVSRFIFTKARVATNFEDNVVAKGRIQSGRQVEYAVALNLEGQSGRCLWKRKFNWGRCVKFSEVMQ